MATKIGGDQLRLDDFIKNILPTEDWTDQEHTASIQSIKALFDNSGLPTLSGTIKLYELKPGIYFAKDVKQIYYSRYGSFWNGYNAFIVVGNSSPVIEYVILCSSTISFGYASLENGNNTTVNIGQFTGARSSYNGTGGSVPRPLTSDIHKFLCGNGNWEKPTIILNAIAVGYVPGTQEYSFSLELDGVPITKTQVINHIENGRFVIAKTDDTVFGQYYYPEIDYINNHKEFIFRKISVENGHFMCKRLRCVSVNNKELWYREIELTL